MDKPAAERGEIPSQPSNYVTILHLRERWLKENERIQKEKEEQEQLERQKLQPMEPEAKNDRKPVIQKPRIRSNSRSGNGSGKFPMYYRAVSERNPRDVMETCKKIEDKGQPPLAVSRIEKEEKETFEKTEEDEGKPPLAVPRYHRAVRASNPRIVKESRKIIEDKGEPPLIVSRIEKEEKETCKKTEDEGEPPLAVPRFEKDEKKKNSPRKGSKKKPRSQNEEMDRTSRTPKENLKEEMREPECLVGVQNGKKNTRSRRIHEKKGNLKENPRAENEEIQTPEENLKKEMQETEREVRVQNGKKKIARARKNDEKKGVLKENSRAQNEEMDKTSRTPEENLKKEVRESECEIRVGKKNVRARRIHEKKGILKENPRAQNEEMDRESRTPEENLKEEMIESECVIRVGKKNVRARRIDEKKRMESQCGPETGYTPEMKDMENKLGRISVSFDSRREMNNGGYRGSSQGNWNLHRFASHRQRDVGMIWVRKDEISNDA